MNRISGGDRPPDGSREADKAPAASTPPEMRSREGVQELRGAARSDKVAPAVVDSFERLAPRTAKHPQAMSGKAPAGQVRLTSEHLAQLAGVLAASVEQHPHAERKERARLFARAVLEHERIGRLLEGAGEPELAKLFDAIAEQLEGSPVFAQLVDHVTEGARTFDLT